MSLRIGVLTFHRCINYGSYWQARCLVEGLNALGHQAELLDHRSASIDRAEWRCALQPIPALPDHRAEYAAKTRKFFSAFAALPLSPAIALEQPGSMEDYDLVLIGSDEVWNLRHPWYGGQRLFYGEGVRANRIAAYAASFGNQSDSLPSAWGRRLARLDAISVRDANSRGIVAGAVGAAPVLVLDPCLTFADCIPMQKPDAAAPYLAVYGHGFPPWFAAQLTRWARENGRRVVSIGYANPFADIQLIDVSPEGFATLMAGADAIATNFFHGCVFALANGKPFVTAPSDYRFNKIRDLTDLLGAQQHRVAETDDAERYATLLSAPPGAAVLDAIVGLRRQSEAYLHAVLA